MKNLHSLFYPESVAVVGATDNVIKWGSIIFTDIIDGGFKGRVYPVTKTKKTVYGYKTYKSLLDIDDKIDLMFITTPADTINCLLEDCVKKGVRNIVMISSGFSEAGKEGKILEKEMAVFAAENNLNIVGPNTMGIANVKNNLYGQYAHARLKYGGISIVAQSGNIGSQIMIWAEQQGVGISKFVGSGNEAVIGCDDYLEYLAGDDDTTVILLYLEGVDNGRRFMDIAKKASLKKPVIALKGGRTDTGSRAAQSHTGAMTGSNMIFSSMMKQCGIINAESPSEMLSLSTAFDCLPLPRGNRVGIITAGGGWGVVTADQCCERNLEVPPLPDDIYKTLNEKLPPFWSRSNPVDLVGQPDINLYHAALKAMTESDAFDAIIFLAVIGSFVFVERFADSIFRLGLVKEDILNERKAYIDSLQNDLLDTMLELMEKYDKPIYPVSINNSPNSKIVYSRDRYKYKLVIHYAPENAVMCLDKQYRYNKYLTNQELVK